MRASRDNRERTETSPFCCAVAVHCSASLLDISRWRRSCPSVTPRRPLTRASSIGFTASRGLNRQSCDRDCNARKEPADAEEHQNIVDFDGHGFPLGGGPTVVQGRPFLQSFVGDGVRPVLRRKIKSN